MDAQRYCPLSKTMVRGGSMVPPLKSWGKATIPVPPFEKGASGMLLVPPFEKGGLGGIYSHASLRSTTQRQSPFSASKAYRRGATPVGSPTPKADSGRTILQTKTHRRLHRRFLWARRAAGCGGGWLTALRSPTSRTRQTPHRVLEAAGPTSSAIHRPAGFARARFRGGGDFSGRRGQKSPLTPLYPRGGPEASLTPLCQRGDQEASLTP